MSKHYCTTNGRDPSLHRKLLNNAREMNNNEQPAVIAIREERARIGGVEVAKKTVIAASNEGIFAFEVTEASAPVAVASSPPPPPALPSPKPVVIIEESPPPSSEFSWVDCCFRCDDDYPWYSFNGKGFCLVLFLLLGYLVAGVILLALWLIAAVCACICSSDRD